MAANTLSSACFIELLPPATKLAGLEVLLLLLRLNRAAVAKEGQQDAAAAEMAEEVVEAAVEVAGAAEEVRGEVSPL